MRICEITIANFRALQNVNLKKPNLINVIVGPNAVGKSTVLDAVRLCKVLLSSRYNEEGTNTLVNMSALSANFQVFGGPGIDLATVANDPSKTVELSMSIELSENEIETIKNSEVAFAMTMIQNTLVATRNDPLAFTQYLSSAEGQSKLQEATKAVRDRMTLLQKDRKMQLHLTMDPTQKIVKGSDDFAQTAVSILDRRLPIQKTIISLFSADRQFPQGEQNLQLGSADTQSQLMSYMSNPSLKYARLKQVLMQHMAFGAQGFEQMKIEFNLIFDNLLPGKKLYGININPIGLLKVLVIEESTGKIFDIDQMSSGEKGLVLTFLFIRLSLVPGGIVLLDEPELHLNSLVQSKLVEFIKKHIATLDLQIFICTHSPEIVKSAFEEEKCNLYHLRSGIDMTPIHFNDHAELFDIFERLGNSPADVLFTRGNIFVEGADDNHVLQAGYAEQTIGFKIDPLGGRAEIEKEVPALQKAERDGLLKKKQLFILDNDRKPTKLKSTNLVKVYQHDRYCFENYLLNEDIMYDLIRAHGKSTPSSRATFASEIEQIALSQIEEIAIHETYANMRPNDFSLKNEDTNDKSINDVAETIAKKLDDVQSFLNSYERSTWISNFIFEAQGKKESITSSCKTSWRKLSSGKSIIDELYRRYEISMRKVEFKKEIMRRMATIKTDDWRILDQVLRSELS